MPTISKVGPGLSYTNAFYVLDETIQKLFTVKKEYIRKNSF